MHTCAARPHDVFVTIWVVIFAAVLVNVNERIATASVVPFLVWPYESLGGDTQFVTIRARALCFFLGDLNLTKEELAFSTTNVRGAAVGGSSEVMTDCRKAV